MILNILIKIKKRRSIICKNYVFLLALYNYTIGLYNSKTLVTMKRRALMKIINFNLFINFNRKKLLSKKSKKNSISRYNLDRIVSF
jgi:hypothetical protein